MPVFRFNRAIGIARGIKVFLNLESGVTRGPVPGAKKRKKQAKDARNKDARPKNPQLTEAEELRIARRRIRKRRKVLRSKDQEIYQLKNELRAARGQLRSDQDVSLAPQAPQGTQAAGESEEMGALPDFVVIGAQKCGTTSFYHLLVQHPDVEPAVLKELHYFDDRFEKGTEWYRRCFPPPEWKDGRRSITGEATPKYLFHSLAPERMAQVAPQARLIVLLRNPVDRAYSHYHHIVRNGGETRSFEEAMEEGMKQMPGEEDKASEREHRKNVVKQPRAYLSRGIYVDQLQRWSEFFGDEQMLVLKSEDFFKRKSDTMKLVMDFLDLPDWESEAEPESSKIRNKGRYTQPMDPAIRQRLDDYFRPHNQRLYEHLGVDFGW